MELGGSLPHSQEPTTYPYRSQINPFFCPSHFWQAQLVSCLVGLMTYQHPGYFCGSESVTGVASSAVLDRWCEANRGGNEHMNDVLDNSPASACLTWQSLIMSGLTNKCDCYLLRKIYRYINKNPTRCNSMQIFNYCKVTLHVSGVTAPIIRSTKKL